MSEWYLKNAYKTASKRSLPSPSHKPSTSALLLLSSHTLSNPNYTNMSSYSAAFSSPLGSIHNSPPAMSSSLFSFLRSSKVGTSTSSKKSNQTPLKEPLSLQITSELQSGTSTYTGLPPSYYQATGLLNKSAQDVKEEKRMRKEMKLREADERMSNELKTLVF